MGKRWRGRCSIGRSSSSSSSSSGSGSDGGGSDSESARRAVGKPNEGGREPEGDEARGPTDKETQFFYMEFAKSNKASCQSCGEAIAEGELRAIIPGLSNSFLHVACVEWSVGHDNRQTCRGCNVKLRKGEGRIGGENAWFGGGKKVILAPSVLSKGPRALWQRARYQRAAGRSSRPAVQWSRPAEDNNNEESSPHA